MEHLKEYAATQVSSAARGHQVRSSLKRNEDLEEYERSRDAAAYEEVVIRDMAARRIQAAWQSYRNHKIYCYYRDLIQFRERGDPKELLRSINPREAQLADVASGIHVRFRLGGTLFPPLVFYKIYTHRPVTDICSFCPRDYVNERRMVASEMHNKPSTSSPVSTKHTATAGGATGGKNSGKGRKVFSEDFEIEESYRQYLKPDGTVGFRSTHGWYEREENNGWRPINERLLVEEDPVTTMTKLKRLPFFHHSPGVRREERLRQAKQRKREWMAKMYREAGGQAAYHLDEAEDEQLDENEDEVLQWSEQLDFADYSASWLGLATTLGSDAFQPETIL